MGNSRSRAECVDRVASRAAVQGWRAAAPRRAAAAAPLPAPPHPLERPAPAALSSETPDQQRPKSTELHAARAAPGTPVSLTAVWKLVSMMPDAVPLGKGSFQSTIMSLRS